MSGDRRLKGICLRVSSLGENDRLLTLLSEKEGITRLAVPGAKRPRSSLSGAVPLTLIEIQVVGRRGLARVKQLKVLQNFSRVGQRLETLAAAQALAEMSMLLVGNDEPLPGMLDLILMHWERLETISKATPPDLDTTLAIGVQALVHMLAIGGYALPVQECCRSGEPLAPPLGKWEWRCSLIPEEGFAIGSVPGTNLQLNPSELALLQRLLKPGLPINHQGKLLGPREVWLRLLGVVECWTNTHLLKKISALTMLRESLNT